MKTEITLAVIGIIIAVIIGYSAWVRAQDDENSEPFIDDYYDDY